MNPFAYGPINRWALQYRLERERPSNDDRDAGYALVYVRSPDAFAEAHIPLSINIPRGREHLFERRFAETKEIVLYGEDGACWAARSAAAVLLNRGFVRVYIYEGGLRDWQDAGLPVEDARAHDDERPGRSGEAVTRPFGGARAPISVPGRSAKSTIARINDMRPSGTGHSGP